MSGKRFKNVGKDIFQYGEWWCGANGEHCADVITTALNELLDENEWLRHKVEDLEFAQRTEMANHRVVEKELKEENGWLKEVLQEVEYELTSLNGLSAFDKCVSQLGYVEVFDDDRIDLDYSKLLKRIEKVMME